MCVGPAVIWTAVLGQAHLKSLIVHMWNFLRKEPVSVTVFAGGRSFKGPIPQGAGLWEGRE